MERMCFQVCDRQHVDRPLVSPCCTQLQPGPELQTPRASPTSPQSFLQRRDRESSVGGKACSKLWPRPGVRIWDVRSVGGLTVGCGRVSVSVIPPEEHVEGQIRNVVALLMEQRENTTLNDNP